MAIGPQTFKSGGYYDEDGNWVHVEGRGDVEDPGASGWFGQTSVMPDEPDPRNFSLGGQSGYARERDASMRATGDAAALDAQSIGNANNTSAQLEGYRGQATARADANTLTDRGLFTRTMAQADALGYGSSGRTANKGARNDASGYFDQGAGAAAEARTAAAGYSNAAASAGRRTGPVIDTTGADRYSGMADAARDLGFDSRVQSQGARDLQMQDRGAQYDALGRVRGYYERGPGPSAAEAQLEMGSEKNMAAALALARSGRGSGVDANAERQAMFQNAATGQELNQQKALLRATEEDAWRGRQLQAMGLEQSGLGNIATQDAGIREGDFALRSQDMQLRAQDLQAQGMSFEQAQAQAQLEADQRARNDQMVIAMRQLQESASSRAGQMGLSYAQLAEGARARGLTAEQFYAELMEQARGRGDQTAVSYDQLGVQRQGQGDDYNLGMFGVGSQNQLGMYGIGSNAQLGFYNLGQDSLNQDLQASIAYENLMSGNIMQARAANAEYDQRRDASNLGFLGGILDWSDVRKKREIKLEDVDSGQQGLKAGATQRSASMAAALGYRDPSSKSFTEVKARDLRPSTPYEPPVFVPREPLFQPRGDDDDDGGILDKIPLISDRKAKAKISGLEAELDAAYRALDGPEHHKAGRYPTPKQPDHAALDQMYRALGGEPNRDAFDHRSARGYSYEYKDPTAPGAAPGRQYGPMAQDLLESPATASTVRRSEDGQLAVDTGRLALVNTSAIGQQQREQDELEQMVRALAAAQGRTERGIRSPRAVYPGGL